MNFILYAAFVYMIIHLSKYAFKKGEQTRDAWEDIIVPQLEKTFFGNIRRAAYYIKISFLSLFAKKYKLIKLEIKKPYNELFSEELVNLMVKKCYVQEIRNEVNHILLYKEGMEHKKFKFSDSIQQSTRLQFFEIKQTLNEVSNKNILRIVQKMHSQNKMMKEEKEIWKTVLVDEKILDETGNESGIDLLIEHEIEQKKLSRIENNNQNEVITRILDNEVTKRF